MSDTAQGPNWWQASDGKWYAPELHPDYQPPPPPPPQAAAPSPPPPAAPGPAAPSWQQPPVGAPQQQQPAAAWSPTGQPPSAPVAGAGPAFSFNLSRWSQPERISAVATLVLFISLFLPWFTYNSGFGTLSVSGLWHGWMYLTLLLCLAIFAFLVILAGFDVLPFKLPLAKDQLLLIATGVNAVLTVIAFLAKPGGFGGIGWGFGAFLGLAAAIVAFVPLLLPVLNTQKA